MRQTLEDVRFDGGSQGVAEWERGHDTMRSSHPVEIMIVRTSRDIGAAVRDARIRQGWTQAELADLIDAPRKTAGPISINCSVTTRD